MKYKILFWLLAVGIVGFSLSAFATPDGRGTNVFKSVRVDGVLAVAGIDSNPEDWNTVLQSMSNYTHVASSSNWLVYNPTIRTLSGCVTNQGSGGVADLNGWSGYPATQMITQVVSSPIWVYTDGVLSSRPYAEVLGDNMYVLSGTNFHSFDGSSWTEINGPGPWTEFGFPGLWKISNSLYSAAIESTNVFKFDGASWERTDGPSFNIPGGIGGIDRLGVGTLDNVAYIYGGSETTYTVFDGVNWSIATNDLAIGFSDEDSLTSFDGYLYLKQAVANTNFYKTDGETWEQISGPDYNGFGMLKEYKGKLWLVGGENDSVEILTNVWSFNGTSWAEENGLPEAQSWQALCEYKDALYSISGVDSTELGTTNTFMISYPMYGFNSSGIFVVVESGESKTPLYVGDDVGTTNASEINVQHTPVGYSATATYVEEHLVGIDSSLTNTAPWTNGATGSAFLRRDGSLPMTGDLDGGDQGGTNFALIETDTLQISGGSPAVGDVWVVTNANGTGELQPLEDGTPGWSLSIGSGEFTFSNNVYYVVPYDTIASSNSITFDFENYRVTPKVDGWYIVRGDLYLDANPNSPVYDFFGIRKNGSVVANGACSEASSYYTMAGDALIYFNGSGDYVDVYMRQRTGNDADSHGTSYFEGRRIGK